MNPGSTSSSRTSFRAMWQPASIRIDLNALTKRINHWDDWCRMWSEQGARHEGLANEAAAKGRRLTAAEANLRAALCYHYGKHLFADKDGEFRVGHEAMLCCYTLATPDLDPPLERGIEQRAAKATRRRRPAGRNPSRTRRLQRGTLAQAFIDRGMAALTLDGPGQGETAFLLPTTHDGGRCCAVIDARGGGRSESRRAVRAACRRWRAQANGVHRQLRTVRLVSAHTG